MYSDQRMRQTCRCILAAVVLCVGFVSSANANVHLWYISEVYSSSDGTVQYIELYTDAIGQEVFKSGGNNTVINSKDTAGNVTFATYPFPSNSQAPTNGHHVLIGTSNLAATLNVIPDFTMLPSSFLQSGGGLVELFSPNWGEFASATYLPLPGGNTAFVPGSGLVPGSPTNYAGDVGTFPSPAVPGDFDGDNDVDGADFVAWQTNFPKQTGGTLETGDADNDGDVDGADFVVWQTNFPYPSGAAVVPEPSAFLLAAIAGMIGFFHSSRRARLSPTCNC
jgi:hypothetical protein